MVMVVESGGGIRGGCRLVKGGRGRANKEECHQKTAEHNFPQELIS